MTESSNGIPVALKRSHLEYGEDGACTVFLFCEPVPASRPRVRRYGGVYYGKRYTEWREFAERYLPRVEKTYEGMIHVEMEIVCSPPKTVKRSHPRGDIDNYIKAMLDAMTGTKDNPKGYWLDDDQIVSMYAMKRFTLEGEEPYIRVTYAEVTKR